MIASSISQPNDTPTFLRPDGTRLRVLAIAGSLRAGSYNRLLLNAAAAAAPPGIAIDVYDELPSIPLFDEDLERESEGGPDAVRRLRRRLAASDALLVATPEYNQSIPAVTKNVLDWLSRTGPDEGLSGKPVAVIGVTTGRWGTRLAQAAARQTLVAMGALVLPEPMFFAADAAKLFDERGILTHAPTLAQLLAVLAALDAWVTRLGPAGAGR